ncbi:MAG TPA: hypothetical protein VHB49_19370 [Bradyrhizobium sp.]|nr:hypothetical protein [Bradyrhizobium sp.]
MSGTLMADSEDQIALAAEYALGTLETSERAQVEAMMSSDAAFAALVQAWEFKFGALNQMVGLVEPRAEVWERIRDALGHARAFGAAPQAAPSRPQMSREPMTTEVTRRVADNTADVIRLLVQLRRWRALALIASAVAIVLAAIFVAGIYRPDLLPASLRQAPQAAEAGAPSAK